MNNRYMSMPVIVTESGDNFHLFADCRALAQGRRLSVAAGRDLSVEETVTAEEAIDESKFACRLCHKAAGLEVPVVADRKAVRAMRKSIRANAARNAAAVAAHKAVTAEEAIAVAVHGTIGATRREAKVAKADAKIAENKATTLASIAVIYAGIANDRVRWAAARQRFDVNAAAATMTTADRSLVNAYSLFA
jgi:hypothetical protein